MLELRKNQNDFLRFLFYSIFVLNLQAHLCLFRTCFSSLSRRLNAAAVADIYIFYYYYMLVNKLILRVCVQWVQTEFTLIVTVSFNST